MKEDLKSIKSSLSVLLWSLVGANIPESNKKVDLDKLPFYFGSIRNYIILHDFSSDYNQSSPDRKILNTLRLVSDNISIRIEELLDNFDRLDKTDKFGSKELSNKLYNFQANLLKISKELTKFV